MMASLKSPKASAKYMGNVKTAAGGMNLGSAVATEMRHKPAGSDLVIANSSETIIPAGTSIASGGGNINIDSINISGVQDPEAIANQVAEEILIAVRRSAYGELYTS